MGSGMCILAEIREGSQRHTFSLLTNLLDDISIISSEYQGGILKNVSGFTDMFGKMQFLCFTIGRLIGTKAGLPGPAIM